MQDLNRQCNMSQFGKREKVNLSRCTDVFFLFSKLNELLFSIGNAVM